MNIFHYFPGASFNHSYYCLQLRFTFTWNDKATMRKGEHIEERCTMMQIADKPIHSTWFKFKDNFEWIRDIVPRLGQLTEAKTLDRIFDCCCQCHLQRERVPTNAKTKSDTKDIKHDENRLLVWHSCQWKCTQDWPQCCLLKKPTSELSHVICQFVIY